MPTRVRQIPILYTIPNFVTAGSGLALYHVLKRLDRQKFLPSVGVLKSGGRLQQDIRDLGISVEELPFSTAARPVGNLPVRIWLASQHFKAQRFQLWHSYHYSDDYTEPLIARAAGTDTWIYTKKNMSWNGRAWKLRTRFAAGIAAQNSTMIENFFSQPNARAKARLIPPGVDTNHYRPGVEPKLNVRARLELSPEVFLVGCVAHLVPVKGHPTLIAAVAQTPDVHLVLAGRPLDEAYAASLHKQCADLKVEDRVHFLDNVDDIPALHAELDAFVLPTWAKFRMEGCPVALLEAMACGVAAISTRIPGAQDVIETGKNGILVAPESVSELAAALATLRDSPEKRRTLGEAARKHMVSHYSIEREVDQLQVMYAEVLGI